MAKGLKIETQIDGRLEIGAGTYEANSPIGKLVEDVRHAIAEQILKNPKFENKNIKTRFEFEDGFFLEYGVKIDV